MNNPLKYTCLFGGGAIRGLSYIGTIRALEELGIEYDIIGGSSVGAIIAAFVACGYKSYEIENFFMKVSFDLFKDINFGLGNFLGFSKGEIFTDWLNEILNNKFENIKNRNLKFSDLEKQLVIITTNLTDFCSQEFSTFETPDFEIAQAVKVSSSMPGLMSPFKYNDSYLADGDLQKASPMWKLSEHLNDSDSRILEFRLEGECSDKNDKNPISFINTIYSCVTDVATRFVSNIYGKNDRYDCVSINTGKIFFADFNLNKEARRNLINLGYEYTMKYFKEILPEKKRKLEEVYTELLRYLKNLSKSIKSNNVEEVKWWLGHLYIVLCENKEIIDPNIYLLIEDLKQALLENINTILFIHTRFKNVKILESDSKEIISIVDDRLKDIKLFLQSVK